MDIIPHVHVCYMMLTPGIVHVSIYTCSNICYQTLINSAGNVGATQLARPTINMSVMSLCSVDCSDGKGIDFAMFCPFKEYAFHSVLSLRRVGICSVTGFIL